MSGETWKVLNYEIGCNSCIFCVEKQQALRENRINLTEYKIWKEMHESSCQANIMAKIVRLRWNQNWPPLFFESQLLRKYFIPQSLRMVMIKVLTLVHTI